ncbi:pyrroline-5-carboxylate reductase [Patescibacteria group bacterium]|nr:pyrroline-5-carboxylate reductase [Patescibacteria group bacterium]
MTKIGIIGAGNMGSAIYRALSEKFTVSLCDSSSEKVTALDTQNACDKMDEMDVIILAVKPQTFESLSLNFEGKLVISIMAGISLSRLPARAVRSMPNLPIQVKKGVVGWTASAVTSLEDKKLAAEIFSSFGTSIEVQDESLLDAITALSGSGPAYFFYFTELLAQKAQQMGFSAEESRLIAEQTFTGSAALLEANSLTAENWRQAVTSKGGTTEAALKELSQTLPPAFNSAIDAAFNRSKELNS